MPKILGAGVEILIFLLLMRGFQAPLRVFVLVGGGVSIHDTYVANTFRPLHPVVSYEEIYLQISCVL